MQYTVSLKSSLSCQKFIRNGLHHLWYFSLGVDKVALSRPSWLSLQVHFLSLLLGYPPLLFVLLHSSQEVLPAVRVLDVFNTDIDPLLQNSISVMRIMLVIGSS